MRSETAFLTAIFFTTLLLTGGSTAGNDGKLIGIIIPNFASTKLLSRSRSGCPDNSLQFNPLDLVLSKSKNITVVSAVDRWIKCMSLDPYDQTDHPQCESRPVTGLSWIKELDPGFITGPSSNVWEEWLRWCHEFGIERDLYIHKLKLTFKTVGFLNLSLLWMMIDSSSVTAYHLYLGLVTLTMLRCRFVSYLFLLLLLVSPWMSLTNSVSLLGGCNERSEPNTEFVVDTAGKVSLMQKHGEPIWSFSSGSPTHSLYQGFECTCALEYMTISEAIKANGDGYYRWKVDLTIEDLVTKMPTSISTKSSFVDGMSGRPINYSYPDAKLRVEIKQKDLTIIHVETNVMAAWRIIVASFVADLQCDPAFNSGNELGPEIRTGVYLPLKCGSYVNVRPLGKPQLYIKIKPEQEENPGSYRSLMGKSINMCLGNFYDGRH